MRTRWKNRKIVTTAQVLIFFSDVFLAFAVIDGEDNAKGKGTLHYAYLKQHASNLVYYWTCLWSSCVQSICLFF